MPDKNSICIRKFNSADREEVRKISCRTAFLGKSREILSDEEILADILTLYFTDYEPDSCFVAVERNKVIGYLTGAKDIMNIRRILKTKIIPELVFKALRRGVLLKSNTRRFLRCGARGLLKGEFYSPDFHRNYPATLHINIDENFRGREIGTQLINHYLGFLKKEGIRGVHFGTMSEKAREFFIKMGFTLLFEIKWSWLRYYFNKDIKHYVFGKTLV